MKNPSFRFFFGFLFVLATTSWVSGQEKVRFFDRKAKPPKEVTIIGVIQEESPARIRIKPSRGEARQLPSLYVAKKDWDNALKTYQDLTKTPGVSSEIIQECDLAIAQVLVRAAKYDQAVAKLTELEKAVPSGTLQAVRLQITKAT